MIYPVMQKNNLDGKAVKAEKLNISGEFSAVGEKVLKHLSAPDGVSVSFVKASQNIPADGVREEAYSITVSESEIIIASETEIGAFRGANTLSRLIREEGLKEGTAVDYPLFKKRGYIEGFYGPTWEQEKRASVMKLMAAYGMNSYFYAPKDDLYHRELWRELYPREEYEQLEALFSLAKENYLSFCWSVGPGLTYCYTSESDFNQLMAKIESIYKMGVRNFGLLLDDIPWEFQYDEDSKSFSTIAQAHVDLINKTYNHLKALDSTIHLTVCPTQYSGDCAGEYIREFGKGVPKDVDIFWTGAEICSRVLPTREAKEFIENTDHKPIYWDNYPVNDCEMYHELHLGAIIGRDKDLYKHCEGIISNVMEYAECSKIPLLTIADFLWNPEGYNPDESLQNAHREILGDKAESFSYFADHLGVSCLSRYSSAFMSKTLGQVAFLEASGRRDEAIAFLDSYIEKMRECLELISDTTVPLFAEMQKWVKKFSMCCDLLDCIREVKAKPTEEAVKRLEEELHKYNYDAVLLTGFCLRETAEKTLKKCK